MKNITILLCFLVTVNLWGITSKKDEIPDDTFIIPQERQKLEQRQEEEVREKWDRDEERAQALEKRQREVDEAWAEDRVLE